MPSRHAEESMEPIYPPSGPQDAVRYSTVKKEDREYLAFCLEFCAIVLKQRPNHLEALELAANQFTALGYYQDGLKMDERLVKLRPRDPNILYNFACSLALTGRRDDAILALVHAVNAGYNDYRHMQADKDLGAVRHDPRFIELLFMMGKRAWPR